MTIASMDYNDIYESVDSEIIHLPNSETYMFANRPCSDITRDFVSVARQFVNDAYADSLERYLISLLGTSKNCDECEYVDELMSIRDELDLAEEAEFERDELLSVVHDISDTLNKFETKHRKQLRLTRLEIIPLLEQLKDIVKDYD